MPPKWLGFSVTHGDGILTRARRLRDQFSYHRATATDIQATFHIVINLAPQNEMFCYIFRNLPTNAFVAECRQHDCSNRGCSHDRSTAHLCNGITQWHSVTAQFTILAILADSRSVVNLSMPIVI